MGFFGLFGGFNPSKCKTALRLCIGRIKLLKNKKGLAARALRKEIADLLGADKTESARVRIEGVMTGRRPTWRRSTFSTSSASSSWSD